MIKDNESSNDRCFRRDGFIPSGYTELARDDKVGALAWLDDNQCVVLGFSGRRQRPDFHLRFPTREHADSFVQHWLESLKDRARAAVEQRLECKRGRNPLSVGDVLSLAFGELAQQVAYFEVTACIGACTVEIRELCRVEESVCGNSAGSCAPVPGCYVSAPMRRRVSPDGRVRVQRGGPWAERKPVYEVAGLKLFEPDRWAISKDLGYGRPA